MSSEYENTLKSMRILILWKYFWSLTVHILISIFTPYSLSILCDQICTVVPVHTSYKKKT